MIIWIVTRLKLHERLKIHELGMFAHWHTSYGHTSYAWQNAYCSKIRERLKTCELGKMHGNDTGQSRALLGRTDAVSGMLSTHA